MQMDIQMAVDVVELQPGGVELGKLRSLFPPATPAGIPAEKNSGSPRPRGFQRSGHLVRQMRNFLRGQRRLATNHG